MRAVREALCRVRGRMDLPHGLRHFSFRTKPVANKSSLLQDEYADMNSEGKTFLTENFSLESGETLPEARVRYRTFGQLNKERDNAIVVCHALTGNAAIDSWWGELLGPGLPFDTEKYFIMCANILGSCYGTTGPMDIDPKTGKSYGPTFPRVTIRDSVALHRKMFQEHEGVKQVKAVIGGSLGGMQALEWIIGGAEDDFVRSGVVIACGAHHHAWQIGISEAQRQAIMLDPKFQGGWYSPDDQPFDGLGVAREMAMVTYRSHGAYEDRFGRGKMSSSADGKDGADGLFTVESYLLHQGSKFQRFDANSYIACTRLMDTHDVARGRGCDEAAVLATVHQPISIMGISSDVLYPIVEQERLHDMLPNSTLEIIDSPEGHDGFLLEKEKIGEGVLELLSRVD